MSCRPNDRASCFLGDCAKFNNKTVTKLMTANLKKATKTILNGLRRFFFLIYYPADTDVIDMKNFKHKFKPLGFKVDKFYHSSRNKIKLDYIYNDEVFQIWNYCKCYDNINWDLIQLEHVLLLFGGARGIMQATQFMIDEEINNLRVNE